MSGCYIRAAGINPGQTLQTRPERELEADQLALAVHRDQPGCAGRVDILQSVESEQRFTLSIGYSFVAVTKATKKFILGYSPETVYHGSQSQRGAGHTAPAVGRQREKDTGAWLFCLYIRSGASALERQLIS